MKKILSAIMAVALAATALVGCGKNGDGGKKVARQ